MKRYLLIILSLLFLAAASGGVGVFIAKKRAEVSQETATNTIQKEEPKENTDSANIGISSNENPAAVPENNQNNSETKNETIFSFAILGDTQYFKPGAAGNYQTAATVIKKMNPDLVFGIGDLASSCDGGSECENKLRSWKNILGPLSSKTYPMQGNHDRTGKDKADAVWQKVFSNLPGNGPAGFTKFTYSFDWENSHFVVLDSDKPKENIINETQRSWLEQDLNKNTKENIFVFFHEPAYPTNSKIDESLDVNAKDRDALWNILVKHKVTAVFSGHEHIQARRKVNGIYQFIFGNIESFNHLAPRPGTAEYYYIGPAFGLVKTEGTKITVETHSIDGKLLNSFELSQ